MTKLEVRRELERLEHGDVAPGLSNADLRLHDATTERQTNLEHHHGYGSAWKQIANDKFRDDVKAHFLVGDCLRNEVS